MSRRAVDLCVAIEIPAGHWSSRASGRNDYWFREYHQPTVQAIIERFPRSFIFVVKPGEDCIWSVASALAQSPDVIFNLANASGPWEVPFVQALETVGIPFTGASSIGISLTCDKMVSKDLLRRAGMHVPDGVAVKPGAPIGEVPEFPLIVKPAIWGGASWGILSDSVVRKREHLDRRVRRIESKYGVPAICEQFIVGRDLRLAAYRSVAGRTRIFGALQWSIPAQRTGWGYRTQHLRTSSAARDRAGVSVESLSMDAKQRSTLLRVARPCLEALCLTGPATIDVRVDAEGRMFILEVNANPGLSPLSPIWGDSFGAMVEHMIQDAVMHGRQKQTSKVANELREMLVRAVSEAGNPTGAR